MTKSKWAITLKRRLLISIWNAFDKVDTKVLLRMFDEFYNGYDAFNLLQCILYGELVF